MSEEHRRPGTGAEEIASITWHGVVDPRILCTRGTVEDVQRRLQPLQVRRLTPREYEVLLLHANGLTISQIGRRLFIGESTAEKHLANLYEKLGVENREQAVMTAVRLGLLIGDGAE